MHKMSEQLVAIKSIRKDTDPEAKASTLEEMALIQSVSHPNVIGVFDSFET
jgi:serine/threonine protein kinase